MYEYTKWLWSSTFQSLFKTFSAKCNKVTLADIALPSDCMFLDSGSNLAHQRNEQTPVLMDQTLDLLN